TLDQPHKQALHIPLNIELYAQNGQVIPLIIDGKTVNNVLAITDTKQQFQFEQVAEQPIIALLREFSAPVKLAYAYSDEQLIFLLQHATDVFSQWDAVQQLLIKYVKYFIAHPTQSVCLPAAVVDAYRAILLSPTLDPALIAQILTIPTENELAEQFELIDPDAIHRVREALLQQLAVELADEFSALYYVHQTPTYQVIHQDISKRALKNICLSYLAWGEAHMANQLVAQQYQTA